MIRIKKFVGSKAFYRAALAFALPLILQDTVSSFVNLLDNVMIGSLGTEEMSGVAIVNQFFQLFTMCIYGGVAGANIFAAQYIGKQDYEGAKQSVRFNFIMVTCFSAVFIAIMCIFQDELIRAFLHRGSGQGDLEATLGYAREYLGIMLWQVLPFTLATTYAMTLRLGKDSIMPMKASFAALFTNLIFNYLLIYGKFGFPQLGVKGAAIATVLSRFVQLGIISVSAHKRSEPFPFVAGLFSSLYISAGLTKAICQRGLPLLFNQLLMSGSQVFLMQIYSQRGLEAVAALNIVTTVTNLFIVVMWSFGNYIAIHSGNLLGSGKFDEARADCPRLMSLSFVSSLAGCLMLAVISGFVPRLYNVLPMVRSQASDMLLLSSAIIPIQSISTSTIFLLRAGGMTRITSLFDCGSSWLFFIPAAMLLVNYTELALPAIYLLVNSLELLKATVGIILAAKGVWIKNIVSA